MMPAWGMWFLVAMLVGMVFSAIGWMMVVVCGGISPARRVTILRWTASAMLLTPLVWAILPRPPLPIALIDWNETGQSEPTLEVPLVPTREEPNSGKSTEPASSQTQGVKRFSRKRPKNALEAMAGIPTNAPFIAPSNTPSNPTANQRTTNDVEPIDPTEPQRASGEMAATGLISIWFAVTMVLAVRRWMVHMRTWYWLSNLKSEQGTDSLPTWLRNAVSRNVLQAYRFRLGASLASPVTAGLLRPTIVMPSAAESWATEHIDMALRHESAHVQRRDVLWAEIMRANAIIYWPLMIPRSLQRIEYRLTELACDDVAVASTDEKERHSYRELLVRLASEQLATRIHNHDALATLSMASRSLLSQRIDRLGDSVFHSDPFDMRAKLMGTGLVIGLVFAIGVVRPDLSTSPADPAAPALTISPVASPRLAEVSVSRFAFRLDEPVRVLSRSDWRAARASSAMGASVTVLLASDEDIDDALNGLSSRSDGQNDERIVVLGTGPRILEAMRSDRVHGVISRQPFELGYRAVESLVKPSQFIRKPGQRNRLNIPFRGITPAQGPHVLQELRKIDEGRGSEVSMAWPATPEVREIEVVVPHDSQWWWMFQEGAARAAEQAKVDLRITNLLMQPDRSLEVSSTEVPAMIWPTRLGEPFIESRKKGDLGWVGCVGCSGFDPVAWKQPDTPASLALYHDPSRLAKQTLELSLPNGSEPVWVVYQESQESLAQQLATAIASAMYP